MSKNALIVGVGLAMLASAIAVYYLYGVIPGVIVLVANSFLLRWIRLNVK
ncbi:MAG TPA: hypothetical protein VJ890_12930 [Vineibacter sp.]|nr:hypothetical protein [Vineibacter sp.]